MIYAAETRRGGTIADQLSDLIQKLRADEDLKARFLTDPKSLAHEYKVELTEEQGQYLEMARQLNEATEYLRRNRIPDCDPTICYPVDDIWEDIPWKIIFDPDWVTYPEDPLFRMKALAKDRLHTNLVQFRLRESGRG